MDKIRDLVYEKQCSLCGYEIEMSSYVVQENKEKYEVISHLSCYLNNMSKVALEMEIEEY